MIQRSRGSTYGVGLLGLLTVLSGCGGDASGDTQGPGGSADATGSGGSGNSGQLKGPLYVVANEIYDADSSTTYVNVISSLDAPELDPAKAIEFAGGRATVRAFNGALFVAPPNSNVIQRYAVAEDGSLTEDGKVGFGNYGFDSVIIDEWGNTFISPTKAYLFNSAEGEIVIWNPTTMEIEGLVDHGDTQLIREGFSLDGSPAAVRNNRLFRTFSWVNWDDFTWTDEQYLAVYDVESDELLELIPETRCPSLGNRVDTDEDGNLYFSNWIWNVGATLTRDAPESCVLRVDVDQEKFDPNWMLSYPDLAGGRQGAMFAYLGDGQGLISVFHDERTTIDASTVTPELVSTPNWQLWTLDMKTKTATPLEGLGWNTGAISTYHVDGRSFVFVPGADWSVTGVYEIEDQRASHRFDIQGWSYQFFEIR